jgi:ArsR family transcriptional regulator, arsenate/arsenite/antimonite-responsive transcriptional repressor
LDAAAAVKALAALAQDHRLAVFRLLVQAGPEGMAAGSLAEAVGLQPSSMSFHLAQLGNAGLAMQQRQGRSIVYSADFQTMNALLAYLSENCCAGAGCAVPPLTDCAPVTAQKRETA